jgi:hypothetical protein
VQTAARSAIAAGGWTSWPYGSACARSPRCGAAFGYRRLHTLLQCEGLTVNHKKLRRIYDEERLKVRRRGGRKQGTRHSGTADPARRRKPALVDGIVRDQLNVGRCFAYSPSSKILLASA